MAACLAADDQPRMEALVQETGTVPQSAQSESRAPRMPLWVPLLLSLPAGIPLVWTAIRALWNGRVPTAFVHYDLAYYVANSRQHFSAGFQLSYDNRYAS